MGRTCLSLLAALTSLGVGGLMTDATARAQEQEEERPATRAAPVVDVQTGKALQAAIDFLNAEDYVSAREAVSDLRLDRLSPYERSRVEQVLFSIEFSEENYAAARDHLHEAIAAGGLNEQELSQAKYQVAQLFLAEEKWREGADALEAWFATEPAPNAGAWYLLAVARYQLEDLERALPAVERAIELMEKPQESWLQLALALRLQREEFDKALPLLEQLIEAVPARETYWIQLASVYSQLSRYEEALAVLQLAQAGGMLGEATEVLQLVDLLMLNEIPFRAARLLEQAIADERVPADVRSLQKLADCWIAAREFDRSTGPLERAAELDTAGNLFVRLGEVNVHREDWAAAAAALQRGIEKGGLRDTGSAELLLGIAFMQQKDLDQAREWFSRAAKSDHQNRAATGYLQLIDAQQD